MEDINITRHRVLTILVNRMNNYRKDNGYELPISHDDLCSELDCDINYLNKITAPLFTDLEIQRTGVPNIIGLMFNDNSETSYSTYKYINKSKEQAILDLKYWRSKNFYTALIISTVLCTLLTELTLWIISSI